MLTAQGLLVRGQTWYERQCIQGWLALYRKWITHNASQPGRRDHDGNSGVITRESEA